MTYKLAAKDTAGRQLKHVTQSSGERAISPSAVVTLVQRVTEALGTRLALEKKKKLETVCNLEPRSASVLH